MSMNAIDRALLAHCIIELYNREVKSPETPASED